MGVEQAIAGGTGRSTRRRWVVWCTLATLAAVGFALLIRGLTRPDHDRLLEQARLALAAGDFAQADRLAAAALDAEPDSAAALLTAGEARVGLEDFEAAAKLFDRAPDDGSAAAVEARFRAGVLAMGHLYRASEAENHFRRALGAAPRHLEANLALAELLGREARSFEAAPLVVEVLRQGKAPVDLLLLPAKGWVHDLPWLQRCRETVPGDPPVLLGLAGHARDGGHDAEALQLVRAAVAAEAALIEAQALLGRLLLDADAEAEFDSWQRRLPPEAGGHPDIWSLRAEWAERAGESRTAIRCYWEALRRDPSLRAANYQLAQLLIELGEDERAAPFLRRAEELQQLRALKDNLLSSEHTSLEPIRRLAAKLEKLGRVWEAWGWCLVAERIAPAAWISEQKQRLRPLLEADPPFTLDSANPAVAVDLSDFPLPKGSRVEGRGSRASRRDEDSLPPARISFRDDARAAGIDFQYNNGGQPLRSAGAEYEQKMYEFSGGGAAVLDFDGDARPDLYLTQGGEWGRVESRESRVESQKKRSAPLASEPQHSTLNPQPLDRLYRNLGNGHFEDVTLGAGIVETSFSQGAAAGDFDNDGFADLYVANIGGNRLLKNNGDGTFSDFTNLAGVAGDDWTTSCLIADLSGDGLPELYAVNYLGGADVFERVCRHGDGRPRMCMPFQFPAAQDRVYWNRGDGRFEDATSESGIAVPDGKGLGIVAADFDEAGGLDLFVANDTVANFCFFNRSGGPAGPPELVELGLASGVAFNRRGRAEGSMGVAIDDADGDGRLDLFVTNFHKETNTLYVAKDSDFFIDQSDEANLAESSRAVLGFGTQFLDADLDGRPDLIITNGHVDDLRAYGRPYRMPPQFYRNVGGGRFEELPAGVLGPFFEEKSLGRGLARLDWNGDGREDAVISHLDRPAALLTNTTESPGHGVTLEFRGVVSARDAIGTVVRVKLGDETLVRQLTAGDGYQASNQRQLVIGLGSATTIDELQIRWPSGREQKFAALPADRRYVFIEGAPAPVAIEE
ncbi:MAG: VCBS repeat-containing protein [Planctomycetes bacterium]|nr:VCBS repeat-containing protein [Planctomycetota bacterium]